MKALIIGGAGFVGGYLIDHLSRGLGWSVAVTKLKNEKLTGSKAEVFDLDILQRGEIEDLLNKIRPDLIFHLAAQSSVAVSWKNPGLTVDVNVKGAVNLLDAVRALDYRPRVLLIGSGEEYGRVREVEIPVGEDNRLRPGNVYAVTKAAQNMLGTLYAQAYGMDLVMVRAFNHIGPNQSPNFVVADFCRQVAQIEAGMREPVIRVGNLSAKRDFTDVRDVVRAYALLVQKGKPGETYNVGRGKAVSVRKILDMILAESGAAISVEVDPDRLRPVDVPVIEADISKLRGCTGWQPEISLEDTVRETLDYWRSITKK